MNREDIKKYYRDNLMAIYTYTAEVEINRTIASFMQKTDKEWNEVLDDLGSFDKIAEDKIKQAVKLLVPCFGTINDVNVHGKTIQLFNRKEETDKIKLIGCRGCAYENGDKMGSPCNICSRAKEDKYQAKDN